MSDPSGVTGAVRPIPQIGMSPAGGCGFHRDRRTYECWL